MRPASPVPVLDANKKVLDSVKEVLDIIAKTEMVLASGHLHVSETWMVFEEAQRRGVKRLIFTHPEDIVDASLNDVRGVAAMGAMVEHSLAFFLEGSKFKTRSAEDMRQQIEAAGVESTILCSDFGQVGYSAPSRVFVLQSSSASISVTKMKTFIKWFPAMRLACSGLKPWCPPERPGSS